MNRPKIVCLIGSTRFKEEYIKANFQETMRGKIVLTCGWFSHADGNIYQPTDLEKMQLDILHLRKIELADEVLVISRNGYRGESTMRELVYCESLLKPVRYWEVEEDERKVYEDGMNSIQEALDERHE